MSAGDPLITALLARIQAEGDGWLRPLLNIPAIHPSPPPPVLSPAEPQVHAVRSPSVGGRRSQRRTRPPTRLGLNPSHSHAHPIAAALASRATPVQEERPLQRAAVAPPPLPVCQFPAPAASQTRGLTVAAIMGAHNSSSSSVEQPTVVSPPPIATGSAESMTAETTSVPPAHDTMEAAPNVAVPPMTQTSGMAPSQPLPSVTPRPRSPARSRHRYSHSSSSGDDRRRDRRSSRKRQSRHRSRVSGCSRRSRSSRWRSPSSSDVTSGASGESGRSHHRRRRRDPHPPSRAASHASQLVNRDPLPSTAVTAPPPAPPLPSSSGISRPTAGSECSWRAMSDPPMAPAGRSLMPLISASVTPATWRAHGKAWLSFMLLAGDRDVSREDAGLEVALELLSQLREQRVSAAVAQRRLSGVAFHLRLRGWPVVTNRFIITQALRGWRKEHVRKECRRPVSYQLLCDLVAACQLICSSPFESTLLATGFSLAFFAALRISELLPSSRAGPGGLLPEDVVICHDSVRICIRRSKTDQFGRGSWILIRTVTGPVCPVNMVVTYASIRPQGSRFLVHQDRSPLSRFQFTSLFKKCLTQVGADPKGFGTHSFRIGAATEAARAGLPDADVMRIGRWRSSCFNTYVRPDLL